MNWGVGGKKENPHDRRCSCASRSTVHPLPWRPNLGDNPAMTPTTIIAYLGPFVKIQAKKKGGHRDNNETPMASMEPLIQQRPGVTHDVVGSVVKTT